MSIETRLSGGTQIRQRLRMRFLFYANVEKFSVEIYKVLNYLEKLVAQNLNYHEPLRIGINFICIVEVRTLVFRDTSSKKVNQLQVNI